MNKHIDTFCRKHPGFGIPHLMKYLTIANVVLWVLNMVNSRILYYMTFNPAMILHGQIWRLISFVFIPPSSGMLAVISFYFYYMIGNTIENNWGTAKFTLYLLTGIVISVLFGFILYFIAGINISLNAQYLYLSLFFSFAALYPDMTVLLFFIIPIKMKWLAIVDAAYFVMSIFSMSFPVNLLPVLAILNFFLFCGNDLFRALGLNRGWDHSSRFGGSGFRGSSGNGSFRSGGAGSRDTTGSSGPRVVNFKKAGEKYRREQTANLYTHKCAVCGRTDAEYPELEFRFCSRCAGYHCFCADHINNHIHFQE